jgi:hypothetical protein
MIPEEALALLDGQFGDLRVRIFAVEKLAMLKDSQIALFMPQLIQALKYELFHSSPLSEFLLEKALQNTRVVGHALFWCLKANIDNPNQLEAQERFFLILERFLMCCGRYKNDLFKQNLVNEQLIKTQSLVQVAISGSSKKGTETFMLKELKKGEVKMKIMQELVIEHAHYDETDAEHDMASSKYDTNTFLNIDTALKANESQK